MPICMGHYSQAALRAVGPLNPPAPCSPGQSPGGEGGPSGWMERTDRWTRNIPSPQRAKPSAVLSGGGDPSFIEFGVFHALSSRHEVAVDRMDATIGALDNRWIVK